LLDHRPRLRPPGYTAQPIRRSVAESSNAAEDVSWVCRAAFIETLKRYRDSIARTVPNRTGMCCVEREVDARDALRVEWTRRPRPIADLPADVSTSREPRLLPSKAGHSRSTANGQTWILRRCSIA